MPKEPLDAEILKTREVSLYLKVSERTICRLAASKKIPGFKVGRAWRFSKAEIAQWKRRQSEDESGDAGHKIKNKLDGTNDQLERSLIDLAVESWRFARLFSRVINKLDASEAARYVNQLRYFQKKVEESLEASGLKIVNIEGHPFDPGIAASALNIGDFGPDDVLLINQMVEPIIMGPEGLRKQGTVMLRKVHA